MHYNILISMMLSLFYSLNYNKNYDNDKLDITKQFALHGEWQLEKRISSDEQNVLSSKESRICSGSKITFYQDSIAGTLDSCIYGSGCNSPSYKYELVNPYVFFENDSSFVRLLGKTKDSLMVVYTNCYGPPYQYIYMLNEDNIALSMNGYLFFYNRKQPFNRPHNNSYIPLSGDTVKCLKNEKGGNCTGYVIQGSRAKGKAIHVIPMRKDVPNEIKERRRH